MRSICVPAEPALTLTKATSSMVTVGSAHSGLTGRRAAFGVPGTPAASDMEEAEVRLSCCLGPGLLENFGWIRVLLSLEVRRSKMEAEPFPPLVEATPPPPPPVSKMAAFIGASFGESFPVCWA